MSNDISAYLLSHGINNTKDLSSLIQKEISRISSSGVDVDFSKSLSDAILGYVNNTDFSESGKMSEMQELIQSLDKSILGNVLPALNVEEFASELLSNPDQAKDVLSELTIGHMQALVTTDTSDDEEDARDTLTNSIENTADATTESLAQNLESIIASLNTNITE